MMEGALGEKWRVTGRQDRKYSVGKMQGAKWTAWRATHRVSSPLAEAHESETRETVLGAQLWNTRDYFQCPIFVLFH